MRLHELFNESNYTDEMYNILTDYLTAASATSVSDTLPMAKIIKFMRTNGFYVTARQIVDILSDTAYNADIDKVSLSSASMDASEESPEIDSEKKVDDMAKDEVDREMK